MTQFWFQKPCPDVSEASIEAARKYQLSLTKPAGSLGQLEDIAISFCGWQAKLRPRCDNILVRVFAADHGVCRHGVSAFPQDVTAQMIQNFVSGGAAISVLCRAHKANFAVINMGTVTPLDMADAAFADAKLVNAQLANGSSDFSTQSAMTKEITREALAVGREQVAGSDYDLFIGGEMGIGNTTSASAIYSAMLNLSAEISVGRGTGVDDLGLVNKRKVISRALEYHKDKLTSPLAILQRLGGLEIAALVGAYIACAQSGSPILVDGFISTAAAMLAVAINPTIRSWMMFAHCSAEPAHKYALEHLQAAPILDLDMRLGEGSAAALAIPILQSALVLHNNMASFASAGVSDQK